HMPPRPGPAHPPSPGRRTAAAAATPRRRPPPRPERLRPHRAEAPPPANRRRIPCPSPCSGCAAASIARCVTRPVPRPPSTPSRCSQRSSAFGHTQLGLGIVEVLGASRGKSPLIIEDLDVCTQLRRTTGAPTLSSEEPFNPFNCLCLV